MFPIENMPIPLQVVSNIIPAKWYYIMIKNIMIKGTGISYYLETVFGAFRNDDGAFCDCCEKI